MDFYKNSIKRQFNLQSVSGKTLKNQKTTLPVLMVQFRPPASSIHTKMGFTLLVWSTSSSLKWFTCKNSLSFEHKYMLTTWWAHFIFARLPLSFTCIFKLFLYQGAVHINEKSKSGDFLLLIFKQEICAYSNEMPTEWTAYELELQFTALVSVHGQIEKG